MARIWNYLKNKNLNYDIKLAKSKDLKNWKQTGLTCIKLKKMREQLLGHTLFMKKENLKCGIAMKNL